MPVKVDRSDIPLLVIGVGGTGKDIALSIKRKFIERFKNLDKSTLLPQKTAFLTLDGDTTKIGADPHGLIGNEHCDISFPNLPSNSYSFNSSVAKFGDSLSDTFSKLRFPKDLLGDELHVIPDCMSEFF